eukprot:gene20735-24852_t
MNSLSNEVFCHDGDDDWELVTESTNAPLEPWEDVCAVVPFENNGEVAYAGKVKSGTGVLSTICLWNTENKDYLTLLPTAVVLSLQHVEKGPQRRLHLTTNSVGSTEVCRSTKQKATKHKVFRSKKERRMERISKDTTPLTTFLAAKCQG